MSIAATWRNGLRRVRQAPSLLLILWLSTLAVTLPPAFFVNAAIRTQLGSSLEADTAASGVNFDWMQEFRAGAGPIERSLRPEVIGFAAVLDNTSALADGSTRPMVVVVTGVVYVLLVWFLTPGIVHRLGADRSIGAGAALGTCGRFLTRMLRLNLFAAIAYAVLFGTFHQWLFDDLFDQATRNITVERTAFFIRLACYAAFFLVVAAANLLFDCARVRMVLEDRRSVIASIASGASFIRRNARLTAGVYGLNVALLAVVLLVYALVAPGAGTAGWDMWAGFVVSQAYIAARLLVKLGFWGGDVAAIQARLAYPGFVRTQT